MLFGLAGMGSSAAALVVPRIGDAFDVGAASATWAITLYVLALAVTTAVYGRVADLVGVRIPLVVGVALMVFGALLAAFAPSFPVLLGARLLQGTGAAAMPTLGMTVISARVTGSRRSFALATLAGMSAAMGCLGPLVGGLTDMTLGWRAVLAIPALGVLVLPLLWRDLVGNGTGASLDVLGAVLVAATAAGAVLVIQSPSAGWSIAVLGSVMLVVGAPLVARRVRRRPHGFLPLSVVRNELVVRSAVGASAIPAAWFGLLIAVPAVLIADGWPSWKVGLLLVPSAVVGWFSPRLAGRSLAALGPQASLRIAGCAAGAALLVGAIGANTHTAALLCAATTVVTTAFGIGHPSMSTAASDAVTTEVRGVALAVATLLFMTGGSIGSAFAGGLSPLIGDALPLAMLALLPFCSVLVIPTRPRIR